MAKSLVMNLEADMTRSPNVRRVCLMAISRRMAISGLGAITLLTAAGFAAPAQAQDYPWCLISSAYEGGENCGFTTYEQCLASRLGIGGFCQVNTQYRASGASTPRRALKAHSGNP
jgi:Protein of unknown function (DUF3551)